MGNPFQVASRADRSPPSACFVIFGASGDLTARKLVPALWDLAAAGLLPRVAIVGCARSALGRDRFREILREGVKEHARHPFDETAWASFAESIHYVALEGYDHPPSYERLAETLAAVDREHELPGHRLFYLSTPPGAFGPVVQQLGAAKLVPPGPDPFARVVIEKPFGTDLESARALNRQILSVLEEDQIHRIDHYLGKETVQNLLVFRFANGIFEPLWNARHVDHIQITGAETLGVENRGGYFDASGILRDMVQNHLFQILALATMEPPVSFDADAVRSEKTKVLRALRPVSEADLGARVVRGQYRAGSVLGRSVPGYLEEPGVAPDSATETSVALELFVDNWRWSGVPIYLRSAKRMPKKVTEIAVVFRSAPLRLFGGSAACDPNVLALRIQPDEGIALQLGSKLPGPSMAVAPVTMEFRYASSFGAPAPEAYERLLLDALSGDGTLFTRGDEVEASWGFISPIHEAWASAEPPEPYPAGSWGPDGADRLIERGGRRWRRP